MILFQRKNCLRKKCKSFARLFQYLIFRKKWKNGSICLLVFFNSVSKLLLSTYVFETLALFKRKAVFEENENNPNQKLAESIWCPKMTLALWSIYWQKLNPCAFSFEFLDCIFVLCRFVGNRTYVHIRTHYTMDGNLSHNLNFWRVKLPFASIL